MFQRKIEQKAGHTFFCAEMEIVVGKKPGQQSQRSHGIPAILLLS
jgi:hypothetical protein